MSDYKIENLYEPGPSEINSAEFSPHYLGKKNLIPASKMGTTTNPGVATQLEELSRHLNAGTKAVEIGGINAQILDTIPKQHLEEIRRKAQLAGAEVTLHAPIQDMDPSGFGERGWEESKQKMVERQLMDVIDKAAIINKKGNTPVTIHGSNAPGSRWTFEGKGKDRKKVYDQLMAIERDTGQLLPLKKEERYLYGGAEDGKVLEKTYMPEKRLEDANNTRWDDSLQKITFQVENADKILGRTNQMFVDQILDGKLDINNPNGNEAYKQVITAKAHIEEAQRELQATFEKAYKYAKEDGKKEEIKYLEQLSQGYTQSMKVDRNGNPVDPRDPRIQSNAIFSMIQGLNDREKLRPNLIKSVEDFSKEKASETFANVAMHSYSKHGEKAPVVSIENIDQERFGFSQGKDLRELVEKSREKFVDKMREKVGEKKAKEMAEKLIGVTFDVGHLNISKARGFKDEDLIREAKEVKEFVKHVHLTDNFGYNDSHLPIGMGNVPVQALLEALGDEGERAKKINEVGGWFQTFKTNPFRELLQASGAPIYSAGEGAYWQGAGGFQQSYMEGYGTMLPQKNYEMFGAGFSQLPQSLGGSTQTSAGGRMGGGNF